MTDWVDFSGDQENGVLITVPILQQIINNTTNIYERINALQALAGGITPVGAVMIWYGTKATIPDGFQLADGTNGTPDMRGLFTMGIGSTEGDDNLNETGGATTHSHAFGTISAASKHAHSVFLGDSYHYVSAASGATDGAWAYHSHGWSGTTSSNDQHTHTGAYADASSLPPYKKYFWIARIPT